MVETSASSSGSARRQAALWGRGAREYAGIIEDQTRGLYADILDQLDIAPGTTLLDVGCGSGVAVEVAAERGAAASGLDATPELLAFARQRVPGADFRQGEMERMPYPDGAFDIVTGFSSFQYAANPVNALIDARRVTRPGGTVLISTPGRPERVDLARVLGALAPLMPPPPPDAGGPFALSADGALARFARQGGLQPRHGGSATCRWVLPADRDLALRAVMSGGPITPIIEQHGEQRVRDAIADTLDSFRTSDGSYVMKLEFIYLISQA